MENEQPIDPNTRQVGGDHYRKTVFQHWDWVEHNKLGYLEGVATKYVLRWKDKDGLQDLSKGVHYYEKLHNLSLFNGRLNRRNRDLLWKETKTPLLFEVYQCPPWVIDIIRNTLYWNTSNDIWQVRNALVEATQLLEQTNAGRT